MHYFRTNCLVIRFFTLKNAPRESKPAMLSPPEEKRPIMSARARRRLINSALTEHPVAQETMRTYDAVLSFSRNMVQWLDGEGLSEEANLVKSVKPVILNQVTGFYTTLVKLYFLLFL